MQSWLHIYNSILSYIRTVFHFCSWILYHLLFEWLYIITVADYAIHVQRCSLCVTLFYSVFFVILVLLLLLLLSLFLFLISFCCSLLMSEILSSFLGVWTLWCTFEECESCVCVFLKLNDSNQCSAQTVCISTRVLEWFSSCVTPFHSSLSCSSSVSCLCVWCKEYSYFPSCSEVQMLAAV